MARKPGTKTQAKRSATGRPAAKKPAAGKPAAKKPAAGKPAAKKPAARKPAAKKPAARKPAGGKTGRLKSVAGKAASRFSILVCIDGSEASYRALRYAVRIGSGTDADLTLLYVRPIDQGMRTGGLQISVVRENLLDWGLELPGMRSLKKGRELLAEIGWLDKDWEAEFAHADVTGDPLGDNAIVYSSPGGRSVVLRLLVAPSVAYGILDECELGQFDLVVAAASANEEEAGPGFISSEVAARIAREHSGTVLVTRELEESHGHLVCISPLGGGSLRGAQKDAEIASRCACPVYLLSVAKTKAGVKGAEKAVAAARVAIEKVGVRPSGEKVLVGDPVSTIVEEGKGYSVIVLSRYRRRTGWRQIFSNSIAFKVLARADNSVMITR